MVYGHPYKSPAGLKCLRGYEGFGQPSVGGLRVKLSEAGYREA